MRSIRIKQYAILLLYIAEFLFGLFAFLIGAIWIILFAHDAAEFGWAQCLGVLVGPWFTFNGASRLALELSTLMSANKSHSCDEELCRWRWVEDLPTNSWWRGSCGAGRKFELGLGPAYAGFRFCPHCVRRIAY